MSKIYQSFCLVFNKSVLMDCCYLSIIRRMTGKFQTEVASPLLFVAQIGHDRKDEQRFLPEKKHPGFHLPVVLLTEAANFGIFFVTKQKRKFF